MNLGQQSTVRLFPNDALNSHEVNVTMYVTKFNTVQSASLECKMLFPVIILNIGLGISHRNAAIFVVHG